MGRRLLLIVLIVAADAAAVAGPQIASVDQIIPLVRMALRDPSVRVRQAALGAITARAMYAPMAGVTESAGRSAATLPGFTLVPAEWKGDREALRVALEDDCLALLKSDPDDRVRHDALLAVENLELPTQAADPLPARMVTLLVDLYRHDPLASIRGEAVKAFRFRPSDSPEIRAVLRDALVDPEPGVRHEAQMATRSQIPPYVSRSLSFDEAREVVVAALSHQNVQVRLGAVQALNIFGRPAASYIPTLERMSRLDPDAQVRTSAGLAIEAIQRDMLQPSGR